MTNLFELQKKIAAVREQIVTESKDLTDSKKVYEMRKAFLDKSGKSVMMAERCFITLKRPLGGSRYDPGYRPIQADQPL